MSSDTDTVFVTMYHPSLGNAQVLAPLLAVPTYQSHGWLLLDPAATPPPVATPYLTQAAGDSRYLRDWAGAEAVTAGAIRLSPGGLVIVRTADGTSRATYDATEAAAWTAVGGGSGGGAVASVVGQTGVVTGTQIAADPALRAALGLPVVSPVTTAGALVAQKHNPVDATAGSLTMTLPTGAVAGTLLSVEKTDATANVVTLTGSIRGSAGTLSVPWQRESLLLVADSSGSWWPIAGHKTKASLDAAYGAQAGPRATRFARDVIHGPAAGTRRYSSFPTIVTTQGGALLAMFRSAGGHNATGSTSGLAYQAKSVDQGRTWQAATQAFDVGAFNLQDSHGTRFPGERRIYRLGHLTTTDTTTTTGTYLWYSDDDGATWSAPVTIEAGQAVVSGPMQRDHNGVYIAPGYRKVGGDWQAALYQATDPLGAWTIRATVLAGTGVTVTEWDVCQLSPTNWIGVHRYASPETAGKVTQSTDGGVTWSAPTTLAVAFPIIIGWPRLLVLEDGSVLAWYKSSGGGLRAITLRDVDNPLTAANWKDIQAFPAVGVDNSVTNPGKLEAVLVGGTYKAVYYGEDPAFPDQTVSSVRFAEFSPKLFRVGRSWVDTSPTGESIAVTSGAKAVLATPDRVQYRSEGEMVRITWQLESYSATTVENWFARVAIDGVEQNDSSQLDVGGSSQPTNSAYHNGKTSDVWLAPGLHTIEMRYAVQTGTVPRFFRRRLLTVTPLSP